MTSVMPFTGRSGDLPIGNFNAQGYRTKSWTTKAGTFHGGGGPTALGLGALMQTKGLVEALVLTVVLDAGVIGPATFPRRWCWC
jgi:hypothetical protein